MDWVDSRYSREETGKTLSALIETDCFRVEDRNLVRSAIRLYSDTKADFSDCLILVRNQENGSDITHTFDREAAKLKGYRLIADN